MDLAARQMEGTPEGRADTVKQTVRREPFDAVTRRRGDAEMLSKALGRGDEKMNFLRVLVSPNLRVGRFQPESPCLRVSVSCLRTDQRGNVK